MPLPSAPQGALSLSCPGLWPGREGHLGPSSSPPASLQGPQGGSSHRPLSVYPPGSAASLKNPTSFRSQLDGAVGPCWAPCCPQPPKGGADLHCASQMRALGVNLGDQSHLGTGSRQGSHGKSWHAVFRPQSGREPGSTAVVRRAWGSSRTRGGHTRQSCGPVPPGRARVLSLQGQGDRACFSCTRRWLHTTR